MPRRFLTRAGTLTAHPLAFVVVGAYAIAWAWFKGIDWVAGATLSTWLMTLFIQRAEHRDTQAILAKLDELLRAHRDARNELTHLDEREPEEIERFRARENNEQPEAAAHGR